jgi:hypothetical protein
MTVPYTFATATSSIPLSQLDSNFATAITLGNTAVYLGNTTTSIGNLTLTNTTISSVAVTFPNSYLSNSSVTIGTTSLSLGGTASTLANVTLSNVTISSVSTALTVPQGGTGLTTLTAGYIPYGNGTSAFSSSANMTFDGTNLTVLGSISTTISSKTAQFNAAGGSIYSSYADGTKTWRVGSGIQSAGLFSIYNATDSVTAVNIDSSGNVGIGTTLAFGTLNVNKYSSPPYTTITLGDIATPANGVGIYFRCNGTAPAGISTAGSPLAFYLSQGSAEAMRIDSSGNVGIGTSSPANKLDVNGALRSISSSSASAGAGVEIDYGGAGTGIGRVLAYDRTGATFKQINIQGQPITFVNGGTEAMRIDSSGNLLVGTTLTSNPLLGISLNVSVASYIAIGHPTGSASGNTYANFLYNGTNIGTISQNGTTGVLYNIVSDRRLKENIIDAPSALSLIDSVKVRSFDFKSDGSHTEFGLIAQEFYEVAPDCVSKGDDGEEIEKTWGLDASALVPAMIKAIQEQQALITDLTNRIKTLENK